MNQLERKHFFINKAVIVHNNKYDYSLVEYKNAHSKIKIICPIHGAFEQTPSSHLAKHGCSKCHGNYKLSKKEYIEKANFVHKNRYKYFLDNYTKFNSKITIICPIHGYFKQSAETHLKSFGCPKCSSCCKLNKESFEIKANIVHQNKYDYSLVNYINYLTKVKIICKKHGVFEQIPGSHLTGCGCPKCGYESLVKKKSLTTEEFINKAKLIHQSKYDYSLVVYTNNKTKVKIMCPIHGIFEQTPGGHLNKKNNCPICKTSKGELQIKKYLDENKINYIQQHKFENCKRKNVLPFDFYLPELNICIEYDGIQHFKPIKYFGGEESFKCLKQNDLIKFNYCKKNNLKLIRISYLEFNQIDEYLNQIEM